MSDSRVLSIQSHVVRGYVGNKCSTFPLQVGAFCVLFEKIKTFLQLNGFEVDAINSVQFSTHTFYPHWKGQVLKSAELLELYSALQQNDLHKKYTHLLTGYCRDETFLQQIANILRDLKSVNPQLFYICDPVLGDRGHYYVPEHLMTIYRDVIMPLADVVTPNQFELQELSGVEIIDEQSALKAMDCVHKRGNRVIVVTSTELGPRPDQMYVYGSEVNGNTRKQFRYTINKLDATFVGTGDVFSALLLVWLKKTDNDLCKSVGLVLLSLQMLLRRTLAHAKKISDSPGIGDIELRLIQSQQILSDPETVAKEFTETLVHPVTLL